MPLVAFGVIAFGVLMGLAFRCGVRRHSPDMVTTFHHRCALYDYSILSVVVVQGLWGEAVLAKLLVFNLGFGIGYWTIGVTLLGAGNLRRSRRRIVSPSLIATLADALPVKPYGVG